MFHFLPYAAGSEIHSIEMDHLWSPLCMVRGTGILTRKKVFALNAKHSSVLKNHSADEIYYLL